MRKLRRLAWAAVAAAAAASPAAAQMGGGNAGTSPGGNLGNFQTNPGGGNAGTFGTAGSTTSGTTSGSTGQELTAPPLTAVEKAPQIRAPSAYATSTGTGAGAVQASNFLGPTFANPYYSGILANTRSGTSHPGGFGTPTFGTAAGARGGATAGVTQGVAGQRGAAGSVLNTDPGQVVALPRQIAYTAQLKFTPPPVAAPRLQADLRGVIDRAGLTPGAAAVDVQVNGTAVVLRGVVRDGDEARLVEGLVRLTPGVGRITNELRYPQAAQP